MHTRYLILLLFIVCPNVSHAYLDPGTGSIILQGIIGAIVGALAFFSTGLERVKNAIGKLTGKKKKEDDGKTSS